MTYQERVLRARLADPATRSLGSADTDLVRLLLAGVDRLRAERNIAVKLYAKARRISMDEATENIRDARLIAADPNPEDPAHAT